MDLSFFSLDNCIFRTILFFYHTNLLTEVLKRVHPGVKSTKSFLHQQTCLMFQQLIKKISYLWNGYHSFHAQIVLHICSFSHYVNMSININPEETNKKRVVLNSPMRSMIYSLNEPCATFFCQYSLAE